MEQEASQLMTSRECTDDIVFVWQNIFNNHDTSDEGHSIIEKALDSMMSVAQNINEMKRQHEHAVRLQEIQCHLGGDWDGTDLMTLGGLLLEVTIQLNSYFVFRPRYLVPGKVLPLQILYGV